MILQIDRHKHSIAYFSFCVAFITFLFSIHACTLNLVSDIELYIWDIYLNYELVETLCHSVILGNFMLELCLK